jgi:hypothetical protein
VTRKVDNRDRIGNDIFNANGNDTDSVYGGKKKDYGHKAAQNNGNLITWG